MMDMEKTRKAIQNGNTSLGLELGSTRIKAVLIDRNHTPIAEGGVQWENRLVEGIWTYSYEEIRGGVQKCYADLKKDVKGKYDVTLTNVGAIGISGMMHGYIPLDQNNKPLAGFRTWRNTITGEAAEKLTELFGFNIPQRWSIAHLYQSVLNKEEHLPKLAKITTVAGYISYLLTGNHITGIGEASGIFPIDFATKNYDQKMASLFDGLIEEYSWKLEDVLPEVKCAGEIAGTLTKEGALFLDADGDLKEGIVIVPCEGDAGTGMAATNSVRVRTGNVSAGTSDFAMVVVEHDLNVHREIDMVTTPAGAPVAMIHCNNCTSDINAWVNLFKEFCELMGEKVDMNELYTKLFTVALEGDPSGGGMLSYNYYSGEGVTGIDEGRPVFIRKPDSYFDLASFMRVHLMSAMATLKLGMDILKEEDVQIDEIYGHGGFFKTLEAGQRILSAAIDAPVSVMATAGEGGPYGMALLAAYAVWKNTDETLEDYLDNKVFANASTTTLKASKQEVEGFNEFVKAYKEALPVEFAAVKHFM